MGLKDVVGVNRNGCLRRSVNRTGSLSLLITVFLAACSQPEEVLEGERLGVRTPTGQNTVVEAPKSRNVPARISAARNVSNWTHRGGVATRNTVHARLAESLDQVWSVSIGSGEDKRSRITAAPVSDGARIFTIDANVNVSAVDLSGRLVWRVDMTPPTEQAGLVSGGGLAVAGGVVYATSPYGYLNAYSTSDGALIWSQRLESAPAGPPAVSGDLVYLATRDNQAWAIETDSGRVRWQIPALPAIAGFAGGAGPAVGKNSAVFPFSSGELIVVLKQGGVRLWSGSVSGSRIGRVYAGIGDFASDPVIAGDALYAGTQSGRIVRYNLTSGSRVWTTPIGTLGQILVDGNSLWAVSDEGALTRFNSATGDVLWSQPLPFFKDDKPKRRKGIYAHYGPMLASGRLIVASSDSTLRAFDPVTGQSLGGMTLPGGVAVDPLILGDTLYILLQDGTLRAFR